MNHLKLIKKAKSGDSEAFEELLMLHGEQLYRTAFLYTGNRQDALDIVQETSYKAFVAIKTLKKNKYFTSWLIKILINSAYEFLNKKKRDIPLENIEQFLPQQDSTFSIEQLDLFQAINNLRATYRDAIILFYFQDLPIKEVANIMNIPENTVKTYLHRGKEQLKVNLKGSEYGERKTISGSL
ncbi:sigma-70 family RNA polymerase sigma factor [Ornithinibacillus halophilus]|uniref:RNA polymerase, sigma subunit, SigV n=1 Tax=Ornithinibacillus halophilus TaxID=930117 RepID=A0A1M5INN9_9BACI|nr:sigma-70 family RNA polymerase sigma factor [Ornithinibacillus halophilus]SHG29897.1 RNA polymerase, sigma subunit, SigV [Ornithinibacillus halophilus]